MAEDFTGRQLWRRRCRLLLLWGAVDVSPSCGCGRPGCLTKRFEATPGSFWGALQMNRGGEKKHVCFPSSGPSSCPWISSVVIKQQWLIIGVRQLNGAPSRLWSDELIKLSSDTRFGVQFGLHSRRGFHGLHGTQRDNFLNGFAMHSARVIPEKVKRDYNSVCISSFTSFPEKNLKSNILRHGIWRRNIVTIPKMSNWFKGNNCLTRKAGVSVGSQENNEEHHVGPLLVGCDLNHPSHMKESTSPFSVSAHLSSFFK